MLACLGLYSFGQAPVIFSRPENLSTQQLFTFNDTSQQWNSSRIVVVDNITIMAGKENDAKVVGSTTATDIVSASESNASHELLHFARRGQALSETSSNQESIDGYDPELMSGRTLLTAEEEKKLLRKIDWRLMTLCSLIFMFKNLDSNNVCIHLIVCLVSQD
jgi:hypothetical protein